MGRHVIEVNGIRYKYPGGGEALAGIDFQVSAGESVAVVGANGSGKTTLLLHLVGILSPAEGFVRICGMPVTKEDLAAIRQRAGFLFQDADDQLFMPTVYEDVAFGPRNYKLSGDEVDRVVKTALSAVGIEHLMWRPPYRLSAGEKRAAAIAAVLAMNPEIIVMDEPTSQLDLRARRRVIELLRAFPQTWVMATHDLDLALELCQRVIVLKNGKIVADGCSKEILTDAGLLEECGLELPFCLQGCPVCRREVLVKRKGLK